MSDKTKGPIPSGGRYALRRFFVCLVLLTAAVTRTFGSEIILQGVVETPSNTLLSFTVDSAPSGWLHVGSVFGSYAVKGYDPETSEAILTGSDGREIRVGLASSRVRPLGNLNRNDALKVLRGWWSIRDVTTGQVISSLDEAANLADARRALSSQLQKIGLKVETVKMVSQDPNVPARTVEQIHADSMEVGSPPWSRSDLPEWLTANLSNREIESVRTIRLRKGPFEVRLAADEPMKP